MQKEELAISLLRCDAESWLETLAQLSGAPIRPPRPAVCDRMAACEERSGETDFVQRAALARASNAQWASTPVLLRNRGGRVSQLFPHVR